MPSPLFLARAVYRRRRLRDAARFLPLLGLLLLLLPALGGAGGGAGGGDVSDAIYLFVIWALLIATAALLAPGLSQTESEDDAAEPSEGGQGADDAL